MWYYPTGFNSYGGLIDSRAATLGFDVTLLGSGGGIEFGVPTSTYISGPGGTIKQNQWHHIAAVRQSGVTSMYVNGVRVATGTQSASIVANNNVMYIGRTYDNYFTIGYISNVRIINGVALYSGLTSTVPTAPFTQTSTANTVLLLNATNAGIIDNTQKNAITTYGSAAISTTQSKFGGTSMYFDGSTGYLKSQTSTLFGFGTGDFTLEGWYYFLGTSSNYVLMDFRLNGSGNSQVKPTLIFNTGNVLLYYTAGGTSITSSAISTGQWVHIALSRASGVTKLFVNGTQSGSNYTDTNNYGTSSTCTIGTNGDNNGYTYSNMYVDEVRITNGYARYTSNFTPQTSAFLNT